MKLFKVLAGYLTRWLSHNVQKKHTPLCDFERIRHEVKPCDVLLLEGRTRVSQVIKQMTQSPWSHAMLYIGRIHDIEDEQVRLRISESYDGAPDEQLIIESELGVGTAIRPLSAYEGEHLRICRPKGLSYPDSQKALHYAVSRLGMDYNVRQILDLARFFFPYAFLPKRFGSSLFHHAPGQETKTVCSTMIAEAFSFIQFPILPLVKQSSESSVQLFQRNPKLCTPSDFDYSPYFQIIKYPFLDYAHHSDYRLLPWHGHGILEGKEADIYMSSLQMQQLQEDGLPSHPINEEIENTPDQQGPIH
ncbi:YiiX/YebB-like N1pC/P60 family cysteine hydrolase [uncultured Endozoicomonas sp.]|uniref:YiiX/YebB-like N1pC/P60 family cysteine hydrolase n=1 Tax=uncultured Endozoicomonas sp. TaxID=432652 RepID=UPI00262A4F30|nr:YiiX/YebB-like N1pC/P60 family cysteine hydrolase [uncultured Endozoicomonas sp.]